MPGKAVMIIEGGMTLERLQVIIDAQTRPLRDEINRVQQQMREATRNVDSQTGRMGNSFKKVGKILGAVFAVTAIVSFGKSCIQLGSDLAEVQNVVDVSFGSMSSSVDSFAKNAMKQFGLSETAAKRYIGLYGTMAKQFGFTTQQAFDMSSGLAGAAGDVASFYNISADLAYTKLKSVFSGETETLKDIGIVMTQNALDAYALANGFGKTTAQMSEQEKVALRYQFVMEQLSAAQGDFSRTSGSWANQTRVLSLQFQSLKATIGQGLINAFTPVVKAINSVLERLQVLAKYFNSFTAALFGKQNAGSGIANSLTGAEDSSSQLSDNMSNVSESAKETKNALMGFDEINKMSSESGSAESGAGLGAVQGNYNIGTVNTDNVIDTTGIDNAVSKIMSILEPLKNINFDSLRNAFERVVEAANPLGDKLFNGLEWAYNNVLVPLATWTIQDALPAFLDVVSGALDVFNSALDALQPLWQWAWDDFLQPIAEWTGGVIVDVLHGFADALKDVSDWIDKNQKLVRDMTKTILAFMGAWKVAEILSFISTSGGLINAIKAITLATQGSTLAKLQQKAADIGIVLFNAGSYLMSIGQMIAITISETAAIIGRTTATIAGAVAQATMTAATFAWNAVCAIATAVTTAFGAAVAFLTSPIGLVILAIGAVIAIGVLLYKHWDEVKAIATAVWAAIQSVFQKFDDFLQGVFSKDWSESFGFLGEFLNAFFANVSNIWDAIKRIFSGIVNFVSGVFSGDWEKAWNGVCDIFGGIFDGLGALIKAPLNGVIGLINGAIDGINKIHIDIPDWVPDWAGGGKSFGINIPKLQYLAKGGIVTRATPAIIGENGAEAVMPLERNTGWIDKLALQIKDRLPAQQMSTQKQSVTIPVYVGGKEVTRVVIDDINDMIKSSGVSPIAW